MAEAAVGDGRPRPDDVDVTAGPQRRIGLHLLDRFECVDRGGAVAHERVGEGEVHEDAALERGPAQFAEQRGGFP